MSEDTSKQFLWTTPDFKNKDEETSHLYNRYVHYMSEQAIPPEPNRKEELAYLNFLEKSFSTDPFITIHPKLYGAGPLRLYWKNYREMQMEYRKTFFKNFLATVGLTWPIILYLANRRRYHKQTGVPVTYLRINLFTPDYRLPDSHYSETARRKFRYGVMKFATLFGIIGAFLTTDSDYFKNDLNTRPDFNQMRILTNEDHIPLKEKKVMEMLHGDYFGMKFAHQNMSLWKRTVDWLYPYNDYKPDAQYCEPFFDYKKDYAPQEFKNHYHFNI